MSRLRNKVALITGAASGVGRASSVLFAQNGARVAGLDKDAPGLDSLREEFSQAGLGLFLRCDVSKRGEIEDSVARVVGEWGGLDVLFNNAGIGYSSGIVRGGVAEIEEENWDAVIATNLKSVYLVSHACIPHMPPGSVVLNNSSVMALGGVTGADGYAASKGAMLSLTRAMAKDLGGRGIRVNALLPGCIDTPMIAGLTSDPVERKKLEANPLGRLGTAEEVARAALFLVSDEASFITGAFLTVDGGSSL